MINSWVGSHENEPEYNGNMCGERNTRSIEVVPLYDRWGNANVLAFSDEAIAARNGANKTTKIPLKQRILPQSSRVEKLRSEAIELEAAFKAGEFSAEEYTLLREVAFKKLRRAEELLKKAIAPVQKEEETYEDSAEYACETFSTPSDNNGHGVSHSSPIGWSFFAEVVDELSSSNSLKKPLKIACVIMKTAVHWSHKARSYWNELKAV